MTAGRMRLAKRAYVCTHSVTCRTRLNTRHLICSGSPTHAAEVGTPHGQSSRDFFIAWAAARGMSPSRYETYLAIDVSLRAKAETTSIPDQRSGRRSWTERRVLLIQVHGELNE